MTNSKIHLSPPHMTGREAHYINQAFQTNWIAPLGPNVDAFEVETANHVGANGALAVNSGTSAIHLALILLGVTKGDSVFCSTLTFVASANPILYQDATPVFIDSEQDTWNMSPLALRKALHEASLKGKLPKAVIIVHLYGNNAKMEELMLICNYYKVPIIEDAAESLGSTYKGKASGTFGTFGVYSFNGNKIITTSGGGMLISDDIEMIKRAKFLATQARDKAAHYQHSVLGYNYRMSNIIAGIGRAQIQVLEDRVKEKRAIYERYEQALRDLPGVHFTLDLPGHYSNRWLTTFTINESVAGLSAEQLYTALQAENIDARKIWKPLHLQPLFNEAAYYSHQENVHVAAHLFATGICLPSGTNLTEEEQQRVITCIRTVFNNVHPKQYYILGKYEVAD